ncbi:hypothetical protein [Bacteroides sp. UBA939]|uniref:hypothetical protein n=1 Tax=Bacteroides sp. UBA939 TaxID=1946092 RepID=UPI0025C161DD|nr:hypothetical protein [Bacteroides sp. UBA939]
MYYTARGNRQNPTLNWNNGSYPSGQLHVTKMKDEDENISYEFRDKLGQVHV